MSQQMYLSGLSPPAGEDIFCIVWDLSAYCSYPTYVLLPTQTRKVAPVSAGVQMLWCNFWTTCVSDLHDSSKVYCHYFIDILRLKYFLPCIVILTRKTDILVRQTNAAHVKLMCDL